MEGKTDGGGEMKPNVITKRGKNILRSDRRRLSTEKSKKNCNAGDYETFTRFVNVPPRPPTV